MAERIRRSRKEKITDDISKIDVKIEEFTTKISVLTEKKDNLLNELKEIEEAENRAKEEEELKELKRFIKENGITLNDLKTMVSKEEKAE